MHIRFDRRIALVTGAAQGIGQAIAKGLQDAGARVHVADIDAQRLDAFAQAHGMQAHVLDVSQREAAHGTIGDVVGAQGRLDILVNAAGGVRGQVGAPIEAVSADDWRVIFQANVDGAFWLAQAASGPMRAAGYGRIVNIASGAGLRPSLTGIQAYTAAKHALVGLTRQLSQDLGRFGITCNAIAPGFVRSTRRASGNGRVTDPRARRGWSRASTRAGSGPRRTSRRRPCSWRASRRAGFRGRSCRSTAGGRSHGAWRTLPASATS
jgi:(2S)-[(R)-hydroxy(phenyl)methyl]-succinyl-CoA dehydrogenase BbsD subunit